MSKCYIKQCPKRQKKKHSDIQSDSDVDSDEDSIIKRRHPRTFEHGIGLRVYPTAVAYFIFLHYYIPNDPNYILYNNHDNNELLSMSNFYFTESYLFYNQ